jgi:hypothetical protein
MQGAGTAIVTCWCMQLSRLIAGLSTCIEDASGLFLVRHGEEDGDATFEADRPESWMSLCSHFTAVRREPKRCTEALQRLDIVCGVRSDDSRVI